MKKAIKNKKKYVKAWRLGDHSDMEKLLVAEGAIRRLPDGSYELFSQEAVNGAGEIARPGDYFKVDEKDGGYYPYPSMIKPNYIKYTLSRASAREPAAHPRTCSRLLCKIIYRRYSKNV